jgi:hypothetical protein
MDPNENGFMKSEGDLARVRWMFASVVGAAKGLWGPSSRPRSAWQCPARPGSI